RLVPPLRLGAVPYRDDQVMLLEAECAKLRGATGWLPRVPLEEGIRRTVAAVARQAALERGLAVRRSIVTMAYRAGASHVGAALSAADILLALYSRIMRVDSADPAAPHRDKLVFSKAHASTALYAVLAERGFMPSSILEGYSVDGGTLPGHLDRKSAPGIDVSAGSLGHGLSVAAGLALADRLAGRSSRTFAVLGDGECNEGAVWESALLASSLRLDGLTAIVDCNGWQGFGRTGELSPLAVLGDKWRAFGWDVLDVDGHDEEALCEALEHRGMDGRPKAVLAKTVKGYGVDYMADTLEWHYKSPNDAQWREAMRQLGAREGSG
ncbi:transketolase, partial [Paenibacillus kobensis]|uniref:transketolase n=1 Tax=Paenibacillus kobensis TaxID=59841 RepID=UPI001FE563A1